MIFDAHGRRLRYLRISVTDRCNLECAYCTPARGIRLFPPDQMLSYEEIERVARIAVTLGLNHIRLTGGEPLVRRDFCCLVRRLARIPGLADLSLTTNGILLEGLAPSLQGAGIKRVNINLNTLEEERFRRITGGGELSQALAGVRAALKAGLHPVKINVVLFADESGEPPEADILGFGEMSRNLPAHIRFIEWMPLLEESASLTGCGQGKNGLRPLFADWAKGVLCRLGELHPCPGPAGSGPARYFRYAGAEGSIGFITPLSAPFCAECSRLRLTSTGRLRLCLLDRKEVDLRAALRSGAQEEEIAALFLEAAREKPACHPAEAAGVASMRQIGG